MPAATAHEIWDDPRGVVTNGPPTAATRAVPTDGGYRLSGHWNFSSGSDHATWIGALAPLGEPGQNGDAARNRAGTKILLMPKADVRMVDLWHVPGLRGTGSFSFQVDDHFVPEERVYDPEGESAESGPLYCIPRTLLFATGFATVALGVARKSLEIAIAQAGNRLPGRSQVVLRDHQTAQRAIGEAHAIHQSARAFLRDSHAAVWDAACRERSLQVEQRIQLRVAATHAIRMSAQVVDIAYTLCGAGAIFESNPIPAQVPGHPRNYAAHPGAPRAFRNRRPVFIGVGAAGHFLGCVDKYRHSHPLPSFPRKRESRKAPIRKILSILSIHAKEPPNTEHCRRVAGD